MVVKYVEENDAIKSDYIIELEASKLNGEFRWIKGNDILCNFSFIFSTFFYI